MTKKSFVSKTILSLFCLFSAAQVQAASTFAQTAAYVGFSALVFSGQYFGMKFNEKAKQELKIQAQELSEIIEEQQQLGAALGKRVEALLIVLASMAVQTHPQDFKAARNHLLTSLKVSLQIALAKNDADMAFLVQHAYEALQYEKVTHYLFQQVQAIRQQI